MAQKAPGKHHREGLSLVQLTRMFPNDEAAEKWFVETRWPTGVNCPRCGSFNVQERPTRKPQPYRCRDCRKDFSVKTDTLMHGSNLGFQTWVIAIYLLTTNLKGVSSMKLHRDLGVTQKTAWYLAHRIRETWVDDTAPPFPGPVEVDETYMGGKMKNMHGHKKAEARQRPDYGKSIVVGAKDRDTNRVSAKVVEYADKPTLHGFVEENVADGAKVYTDEHRSYPGLEGVEHEAVKHSVGEYVRGQAHTNGLESFWSLLKRGYVGTYHKMSPQHLDRYVNEFAGRHNVRDEDTPDQMALIARSMVGKRLKYHDLTAG
ncbi:MAG: IS1595 family transposase [Bryobacterales bacterium]|nr:IS1595 family transposase [Bryobacterales bacterium]MDE0436656.1 IS1595 family transposase [Bryobacterales bacterium]